MNREKKAHLPWRCTLGISFILFKKVPRMNAITKKKMFSNIKQNVYKIK